jgi:hypothetical protein
MPLRFRLSSTDLGGLRFVLIGCWGVRRSQALAVLAVDPGGSVMTTTSARPRSSVPRSSGELVRSEPLFTDGERTALAGCLTGYSGLTRGAYALDLRQYVTWCQQRRLHLFEARRADIECFGRDMESKGRARATIARRLCTIAGFYRYAVEEELLDHSPGGRHPDRRHVPRRRPLGRWRICQVSRAEHVRVSRRRHRRLLAALKRTTSTCGELLCMARVGDGVLCPAESGAIALVDG